MTVAKAPALPAENIEGLIAALAHGDEEHRAWLGEAIRAFFAGEAGPEVRGQGIKEARIAQLELENERLRRLVRGAYREGWGVNAIPPEEHDAGPAYVQGCEEADWTESKTRADLVVK